MPFIFKRLFFILIRLIFFLGVHKKAPKPYRSGKKRRDTDVVKVPTSVFDGKLFILEDPIRRTLPNLTAESAQIK